MQQVYGYIRVSTIRQGTQGVSLQEQKSAIEQYARNNHLQIIEWFEERETAAKYGRPVFLRMLKNLRLKKASGVIIHKIDRSARNLKDWAALGELLDAGTDVRFAHDNMDLQARGGRLSADIQAVIASDYIRNLREETRKGFYGRLKQGLYPMRAPIGYLDQGSGQPKIPDPINAPLVKEIFRLYTTGKYSLEQLGVYLADKGCKNRDGGKLTRNGLATILHNPFYIGLIHIRRTGEVFAGVHEPLIGKSLFDGVQSMLSGKKKKGVGRHEFLFRRIFICQTCNRSYVGEKQKEFNYYRCHFCKGSCVREEVFEQEVRGALRPLQLSMEEIDQVSVLVGGMKNSRETFKSKNRKEYLLRQERCNSSLDRLTDAYVDGDIEREIYLRRKESVLNELKSIEQELVEIDGYGDILSQRVYEKLELLKSLYLSYIKGTNDKKREIIKKVSSNCQISGKNVAIELKTPFNELSKFLKTIQGTPCRARCRKIDCSLDHHEDRKSRLNKKDVKKIFNMLSEID